MEHRIIRGFAISLVALLPMAACAIPASHDDALLPIVPNATETADPLPVDTPEPITAPAVRYTLTCNPASTEIMRGVEALGGASAEGTSRRAEDWAVVHIGEGNTPGETWDLVAYRTSQQRNNKQVDYAYITNALSETQNSGERWISVGASDVPPAAVFTNVDWPAERLEKGKQARQAALDCLGTTPWQPTPEADFRCEPPTPEVMAWLNETLGYRIAEETAGDISPDKVQMVKVGPGVNPNENWWVVALREYGRDSTLQNFTFLTNVPSADKPSGDTWLNSWGLVQWPDDRIEHGKLAEAYAISCLD